MRKVGIITIVTGSNFGNRLQNYAVQKIYSDFAPDIQCETILNATGSRFENNPFLFRELNNIIKYIILPVYDCIGNRIIKNPRIKKRMAFERFNKKHIVWSKDCISKTHVPTSFEKKYDFFSTGSDQVWNYTCYFNSDIEYLTFTSPEKKIAIAASFGVTDFTKEMKDKIKQKLGVFKAISVREEAAQETLNELGIDSTLVLDPTMVVPAEHWKQCEKKVNDIPEKYILVYVLQKDDSKISKKISEIAQKNNLPIINIFDKKMMEYYAFDPFEFLWLVDQAELVCTDSFHASVFSILFETPFIVFGRKGMNSRITTLLGKFGLEKRMVENLDEDNIFKLCIHNRDAIINEERQKYLILLENAMK